jgi:hypothetical protein
MCAQRFVGNPREAFSADFSGVVRCMNKATPALPSLFSRQCRITSNFDFRDKM